MKLNKAGSSSLAGTWHYFVKSSLATETETSEFQPKKVSDTSLTGGLLLSTVQRT